MKKLILPIASAILVGCASAPQSDYKQVDRVPQMYEEKRELNICRDGSGADQALLLVYFNDAYVATVPGAILSKAKVKILFDDTVTAIRITAKNKDERDVARMSINSRTQRKIYITSVSKTTSVAPVPLPGFLFVRTKGERQVQSVQKSAYDELCGDVKEVVYVK